MRHSIKCTICNKLTQVNGQKQIDTFAKEHRHDLQRADYITGKHIKLDEPQHRIDLRLDKPALITSK